MYNELKVERLTARSIDITDGDGPKIHIEAAGSIVGIWLNDGSSQPSLAIVMEKGKAPYLAFYTSDREHLPAAVTINSETGQLEFQAARK